MVTVTWRVVSSRLEASGPSPLGLSRGAAAGVTIYPPDSRPTAPQIEGKTLTGEYLSLAEMRGHALVINVWGSWCGPCRAEAPDLARAARESHSKGVRFVGIDTRDTVNAADAFTRRYDIDYPSFYDPAGAILLRFSDLIPISAIPSTVVIDRQGRIAARVVGKVDYSTLRGLIEDVLASPTARPTGKGLVRP